MVAEELANAFITLLCVVRGGVTLPPWTLPTLWAATPAPLHINSGEKLIFTNIMTHIHMYEHTSSHFQNVAAYTEDVYNIDLLIGST